jgi:hypothetical protein
MVPMSASIHHDSDVATLEAQVHRLRQQLEEQTSEAEEKAKLKGLDLLRAKQKCEELEMHREYLSKSEERLKSQLSEARQARDAEHAQRLEERREAADRCEQLRDELLQEAATEREESRRTIAALQTDLEKALAPAAGGASASGGGGEAAATAAAAAAAAAQRANVELRTENEALQAKVAAAERRLASRSDLEESLAAAQAEVTRVRQQLAEQRQRASLGGLSSSAATGGASAAESAALAADVAELRRQLASSDEQRAGQAKMLEKHAALEARMQSWCILFSGEVGGEGGATLMQLSAEGLPPEGAAEKVKARLDAMREQLGEQGAEVGRLQAAQREAQLSSASAKRAAETAIAERDAATAALAEAQESAARTQSAVEQLKVQKASLDTYVEILEKDRDAKKQARASLEGAGAGAGTSAGTGAPGDLALAGEAAQLRAQLGAAEARCAQLEKQAEANGARASEAATALRAARLEAAAAKEQAATTSALSRQASLAASSPPAASSTATAQAAAAAAANVEVPAGTKVLHLAANPASNAQQAMIDGLRARVRALRMQLDMCAAGGSGGAAPADGAEAGGGGGGGGGGGSDAALAAASKLLEAQVECEELRKKMSDLETKCERLARIFNEKIKEFRETVIKLTGFRVDLPQPASDPTLFHVNSTFLPRTKATVLQFRCSKQGEMELLGSDFTQSLTPLVQTYLQEGRSIPAFLAAVTIKLFEESRQ